MHDLPAFQLIHVRPRYLPVFMKTLYNDRDYIFTLLVKRGLLSPGQAENLKPRAIVARRKGMDIIQWLDSLQVEKKGVAGRILEEADIVEALAADQKWAFRRLDPVQLDMTIVTQTIPASFARQRLILPVGWKDGRLEVVGYTPLSLELEHDLKRVCKADIIAYVGPKKDIERVIREFFDFKRSITAAENTLSAPSVDISNLEQFFQLASHAKGDASEKHINKAVDHLFQYAMDHRASDIHIEPRRNESVVRLRIDGIIHVVHRLPRIVHEAICTRIKAMSRLDIAEKRRPQDGRLKVSWNDNESEVRVSTVPVAFGEKMVLRLQSADILFSNLNELGFSSRDLDRYSEFLKRTYGIILMTGPTGSGKSTTLYSTLRHLSSPEVNIVTVEDPIEMVYEEFNQIAVQPQIDVTFASILRNILRQDPDIVMIGEIRDEETARYAVQAALTGHLVFSTLHTNDSSSAVTRLMDLGLEPYLISSTLLGVVAQRLVRMVCRECEMPVEVPAEQVEMVGCRTRGDIIQLMQGDGCARCRKTGYRGRIGIYEVLGVSDAIQKMIHACSSEHDIKAQAIKEGMTTLNQDACRKMFQGITTLEEVMRTTA